jgi:hypothetical protein
MGHPPNAAYRHKTQDSSRAHRSAPMMIPPSPIASLGPRPFLPRTAQGLALGQLYREIINLLRVPASASRAGHIAFPKGGAPGPPHAHQSGRASVLISASFRSSSAIAREESTPVSDAIFACGASIFRYRQENRPAESLPAARGRKQTTYLFFSSFRNISATKHSWFFLAYSSSSLKTRASSDVVIKVAFLLRHCKVSSSRAK